MNEEIMNVEEVMEDVVTANEGAGLGKTVLVGAVVIGAGVALFTLGKKVWSNIKAKKALNEIVIEPQSSETNEDKND